MSRHFELLNYSEHGTIVDNIVYCGETGIQEIKSDTDDAKDKEKKQTYQGLDDIFKRSSDTANSPFVDKKEVCLLLLPFDYCIFCI